MKCLLRKASRRLRLVMNRIYQIPIKINGSKMYVYQNDCLWLIYNHDYEPTFTKMVKTNVNKGDIIIDVGANIGYFTLLFARLVGCTGKVYAFEPEPTNFKILERNVQVNGFENVILQNTGISDTNGKTKLYLRGKNNIGNNSIFYNSSYSKSVEIKLQKLDDIINEKTDVVKIDVDGAEGNVLFGMKNIIEKWRPKIFLELSPNPDMKISGREYLSFLIRYGYSFYELDEISKVVTNTDIESILTKNVTTNLFCIGYHSPAS